MRNHFSFSCGGVKGGRERERERERDYGKKTFFKYSLGKKDNARILFNPNQKILNFAGIRLKDRLVFLCGRKWW